VNVYLKNRHYALKLLIEANVARPKDCIDDHWESMKHFITLKAKQGKATRYHAMQAKVNTPSHFGHGKKVGTIGRLVKLLTFRETLLLLFIRFACCVTNYSAKKPFFFKSSKLKSCHVHRKTNWDAPLHQLK
jgi:hypothetical protein